MTVTSISRARALAAGLATPIAAALLLAGALGFAPIVLAATSGLSTLEGRVFEDHDRSASFTSGDVPLEGLVVEVRDGSGARLGWGVSDSEGHYTIGGLPDGRHDVALEWGARQALQQDWVPTTTGSIRFAQTVDLAGTARVDLGIRRIERSRTAGEPLSTALSRWGARIESYNDAVHAVDLAAVLDAGALVGEESATTVVRFDLQEGLSAVTSPHGSPDAWTGVSAQVWVGWQAWLSSGEAGLFHEWGHVWSIFHAHVSQQDPTFTAYLEARGVLGDPRLGTTKHWVAEELVAEDYRQLFGTPAAASVPQANRDLPAAAEVPGLEEHLREVHPRPPAPPSTVEDTEGDVPPASPEVELAVELPQAGPVVDALTVAPDPVVDAGEVVASMSGPGLVTTRILDRDGRVVASLAEAQPVGAGTVAWTWARPQRGKGAVPAGTYVVEVAVQAPSGSVDSGLLAHATFEVVDPVRQRGGPKR